MKHEEDKNLKILMDASLDLFDTDGVVYYRQSDNFNTAEEYLNIWNTFDDITKSKKPPFVLVESKRSNHKIIEMSNLGRHVINTINYSAIIVTHHFNSHKLHPKVDLFIKAINKHELNALVKYINQNMNQNTTKRIYDALCGFIAHIKSSATTGTLQKEINLFSRTSRKNYASLVNYINKLFDKQSRLLVIRIDLGYTEEHSKKITSEMAINHRNKLLKNTRNNEIFQHIRGYVWKLEFGVSKGYHYHMLFLFDGSKVREDINIARRIGEHWCSSITDGNGIYFNCNYIKNTYKCLGIGMINHFEQTKRENLKKAALYLTKTDNYIKLALPTGARVFGKGEIPHSILTKKGRPRIKI